MSDDEDMRNLLWELGVAMNYSLCESGSVAEVLAKIKKTGRRISIVIEATILTQKVEAELESEPEIPQSVQGFEYGSGECPATTQDVKFLRKLKIGLGNDGTG